MGGQGGKQLYIVEVGSNGETCVSVHLFCSYDSYNRVSHLTTIPSSAHNLRYVCYQAVRNRHTKSGTSVRYFGYLSYKYSDPQPQDHSAACRV